MSIVSRTAALTGALACVVATALPVAAVESGSVTAQGTAVPSYRFAGELAGDFDGNNTDTPGVYVRGTFFLRNSNSPGAADVEVPFGSSGNTPVVGDWDGDGDDTIGVVRQYGNGLRWSLRNSNTPGPADIVVDYGSALLDIPVVGDWDGDGDDSIGIARRGRTERYSWYLRKDVGSAAALPRFEYGVAYDEPVVGDWDGDGDDTVGVVRRKCLNATDEPYCYDNAALLWVLRNSNTAGSGNIVADFGRSGEFKDSYIDSVPLPGDWNGDGSDTLGLVEMRFDFNTGAQQNRRAMRNTNTTGRAERVFAFE